VLRKPKSSIVSIIAIVVLMIGISSNLNWGKDHWKDIIATDGKGYYAYLPALFIYHDLNFGFFDKIEKEDYFDKMLYYDYRAHSNGKVIDKYYCGTALAESPFFFIAHGMSYLLGYKPDGYSKLYHIFINIAALFYLLIGLLYLNASLKGYNIREWEKSFILFVAVFGTNLFYYTVGESGMSHVFSFAFVSMFFYFSRQYFSTFKPRYILYLGLSLGIIVLIRPVNGLIIFILPFASGSFQCLRKGFSLAFQNLKFLIPGVLACLGIASVQLLIYKISSGSFFVDSYTGEGFNFLDPKMVDILVSYRKGLFLYTPVFLVSFTGLFFLWKTARFSFYSWLGFFVLITYVFSSWWNWYYGGSFSGRIYVEFIPVFMVLLAIALNNIRGRLLKTTFICLIVALTVICQVQTYQYRYYQIHWSDMTKEKYWDVFMRIDKLIK
jgi:hypothetical protein